MSENRVAQFQAERERLNELVMAYAGLGTKRFFSLDSQVYREGTLSAKTKEMLGLVASLVLRCDDCITYHVIRCHKEGLTDEEMEEVLSIGLIIGGSITIPHLRRAFQTWDELQAAE
jgi:AhpD family alkylhydroperoxidase